MGFRERLQRPKTIALLISGLIYGCIMGVNFDPAAEDKMVEAFGATPLGLPVMLVVVVAQTLLFIPMPWIFLHAVQIAAQAHKDGRRAGVFYFLSVGRSHPELLKSQLICAAGLTYTFAVCGAWIAYTAARGI